MSEKYYVCSESELRTQRTWALLYGTSNEDEENQALDALNKAEAACRAREIPEWAEEFAGPVSGDGYKDDEHFSIHRRIERIKR